MIIGFVARNHPRQTAKYGGACDATDTRHTPLEFFARLNAEYRFTLDAAANRENALCPKFYDRSTDGLEQSWAAERVWCNPPFSNLSAWVWKARLETLLNGCELVVLLLPANRCEQPWWQEVIEPMRDQGPDTCIATRFIAGRLRFGRPGVPIPAKGDRPPFGCVLVTMRSTVL